MPLRLRGPQRSIAFRPENEHLVSSSVQACQFIPLRGLLAGPPILFQIGPRGGLSVTPPDDTFALPSERIEEWLRGPHERWPTGVSEVVQEELREALHVWLVVHEPATCSVYAETGEPAVPDLFGSGERVRGSFGVVASEGVALLGWSAGRELHVEAAAQAAGAAERLVELIRRWDAAGRPGDADMQVRAYARGHAPPPEPDEQILDERWTRFLIAWRKGSSAIFV
jgi:protein-L-isoaspartate(D-aspartate) O-methyltransferase